MKAWLRSLWNSALLRTSTFEDLCDRQDAAWRGFLVIVAVALLAGLPGFIVELVHGLNTQPVTTEIGDASARFRAGLEAAEPVLVQLGLPAAARDSFLQLAQASFDAGVQVSAAVENLPTPLPRPVGRVFQALGRWLSHPWANSGFPLGVATLGTWLGYGIWVMLAARLLGGRGTLAGFFGATALFAVPHVLGVFGRVPFLGPVVGFVAFVWGAAVYIKATVVSQQLSFERGLLAVLLPLLLAVLSGIVIVSGFAGLLALLALS